MMQPSKAYIYVNGKAVEIGQINVTANPIFTIDDLEGLKEDLNLAVEREQYEKAATIRDWINDIEQQGEGG